MGLKNYKLRHAAQKNGKKSAVDLPLEFEGKRAFVVWDSLMMGNYQFKARVEINPRLLKRSSRGGSEFRYRGRLVLPQPEQN
jgi:hypothetical protein